MSEKEAIYKLICPICGKEIRLGKDKWVWLIFYYHLDCLYSSTKKEKKEGE
jgi:hypothetical protein